MYSFMKKQKIKSHSQKVYTDIVDLIIGVKDNKSETVSKTLRLCGIVVDYYNPVSSSFFCRAPQLVYEKLFNTRLEYNNSNHASGYRLVREPTIPAHLSGLISSVSLNVRREKVPEAMNDSHACFRMPKYLRE